MWVNAAMPYNLPPKDPPFLQLNQDSAHVTQPLLDLPRSQTLQQVDFDFGWLDDSDRKKMEEPRYFPMITVFTDHKTGNPLLTYRCHPDELIECAFHQWEALIQQHGRPETLYVARDETFGLFNDFAQHIGVTCRQVEHLPTTVEYFRDVFLPSAGIPAERLVVIPVPDSMDDKAQFRAISLLLGKIEA